jgi:hypothetical protein
MYPANKALYRVALLLRDANQIINGTASGNAALSPADKDDDGMTMRKHFVAFRKQWPQFFDEQ